jgi:hypothetical protein
MLNLVSVSEKRVLRKYHESPFDASQAGLELDKSVQESGKLKKAGGFQERLT